MISILKNDVDWKSFQASGSVKKIWFLGIFTLIFGILVFARNFLIVGSRRLQLRYLSLTPVVRSQGDIDSRMMAALLMGVNRAYPFAWLGQNEMKEHIDTLFKLVHVCSFNISLQTLCLLYQIVGHSADRWVTFYKFKFK